jgi:hypothetical protein
VLEIVQRAVCFTDVGDSQQLAQNCKVCDWNCAPPRHHEFSLGGGDSARYYASILETLAYLEIQKGGHRGLRDKVPQWGPGSEAPVGGLGDLK